jgi:hypothetical protein
MNTEYGLIVLETNRRWKRSGSNTPVQEGV